MTQIKKKWIGSKEIGSSQILIEKDQSLRGIDQTDTEVDLLKINSEGKAEVLGKEIVNLESIAIEAVVHVEKGGDDATADGSLALPFSTIMGALNSITDASVTKRYVVKVAPGAYSETDLKLKAGVFILGESRDSVRITSSSPIGLDSSFSGSGDHRSGFQQCIVISACDFDWSTVTSAAGKLYFNEVSFSSTVRLYGHNNAIAQTQFNSCTFFGKMTVSGINVGTHTNCFHFSDIDLLQHPNGGMATILNAAGGTISGALSVSASVDDFGRRCSTFLKSCYTGQITIDGVKAYVDVTNDSLPAAGATILNGGNLVRLNDAGLNKDLSNLSFPTAVNQPIMPANSNATNLGDWGKQWAWHFAYVHATTGTDMYLGTYPTSFGADSAGKTVYIMPDLAGLQENADGGNIVLATAAVSGTGVRGKIALDVRELDVGNVKVTQVADGVDAGDAVNKGQLDAKVDADLLGAANGVATLDAEGKVPASQLPSYVDDVLEFADQASFPAEGEQSKIYVALDSGKVYRWSGSAYVEISASPGSTDAVPEGSSNLYFTDERAQAALAADLALKADQSSLDTLSDDLDQEILDREAADSALADSIALKADQSALSDLSDIVQGNFDLQQADIDGLRSDVDAQSSGLAQEILDREAADSALQSAIDGKADLGHTHTASEITDFDSAASAAAVVDSMAGSETDKAPSVSSIKDFIAASGSLVVVDDEASLPAVGNSAKLYVTKDTDTIYYYKDSVYTELNPDLPFSQEKITIGATELSNQYIDLAQEVNPNSIQAYINRLAIHLGDDFTVSVVGGVTRITFAGDIASGGVSELDPGDTLYIKYTYYN